MKDLQGKRILITGATGLIGKALARTAANCGMDIIAVSRNAERAKKELSSIPGITILESDIIHLSQKDLDVDYIIHGAANTSSKAFIEEPADIIKENVQGMVNILEFARMNPVKSFVFLSSMEVYGTQETDEKIDEMHNAKLDPMNPRFCYPESKRLCENLCASYYKQYNLQAKVVRLTQTFGPDVHYNDPRVFAEFARCAIEGRDIILHTKGTTKRSYLYTEDAASAVFTVLRQGKPGEAYNAANESTYCSIYEMAEMVAEKCAKGKIRVLIQEDDINKFGYAPPLHMNLDTRKLQALGWKPTVGLQEMFEYLIEGMGQCNGK